MSRVVFDPERFRDDKNEVMDSRGVGVVYAVTTDGRQMRSSEVLKRTREEILKGFYDPYAHALTGLVDRMLDRFGSCVLVDAHSYPVDPFAWELRPTVPRPSIAFGTDRRHTPESLVGRLETLAKKRGIGTARDVPFSGTYVPLKHLNRDDRVTSVMIEVRRDLYMDEATGEPNATFRQTQSLVSELLEEAASFLDGGC
jgi:N-formylglutamate amidohydrolase